MADVIGGDLEVVSKIPGLFLIAGSGDGGAQGAEAPSWIARELFGNGRSVGAPWTLSLDPGADHGDAESLRKANELVVPWITAVIRQRVSPDGEILRIVTDGFAWMGNNRSGEVAPSATFAGSKTEASWLPDEASARGWQTVFGAPK